MPTPSKITHYTSILAVLAALFFVLAVSIGRPASQQANSAPVTATTQSSSDQELLATKIAIINKDATEVVAAQETVSTLIEMGITPTAIPTFPVPNNTEGSDDFIGLNTRHAGIGVIVDDIKISYPARFLVMENMWFGKTDDSEIRIFAGAWQQDRNKGAVLLSFWPLDSEELPTLAHYFVTSAPTGALHIMGASNETVDLIGADGSVISLNFISKTPTDARSLINITDSSAPPTPTATNPYPLPAPSTATKP